MFYTKTWLTITTYSITCSITAYVSKSKIVYSDIALCIKIQKVLYENMMKSVMIYGLNFICIVCEVTGLLGYEGPDV